MKLGSILALCVGIAATALLIAAIGVNAVGAAVVEAGWTAVLAITLFNAVPIAICGMAWRALMKPAAAASIPVMIWARFLRSSISELVPISGELIGTRVMALHGMPASRAGAATVVDMTVELISQLAFTGLGLLLLALDGRGTGFAAGAFAGLAVALVAATGFVIAQRRGLLRWMQDLPRRLAARAPWARLPELSGLEEEVEAIYRRPRALWVGFAWHCLGWMVGIGEAWLALYFLDAPVGLRAILIIESLAFALRSAAFLVPGAIGIQEGGYAALAALFGLGPELGLALSLLKRAREVMLATAALLAWQLAEGHAWHRLRRGRAWLPRPRRSGLEVG